MPRDTLTREKIVKAAIDLLDSGGLEGLSIRALGSRLGSAATAIYWHVGSKDNLMALAADQAWNEITLPDPAAVGWRDAAMAMAAGLHAMLPATPGWCEAFDSFLLSGPGKARHDDHTLAIYEAAISAASRPRPGSGHRLHLRAGQRPRRGRSGVAYPQAHPRRR